VALEYYLWKTTRAFSTNPELAGVSYAMEPLSKFKPSSRSFWNKTLRDYTGLQVEDFIRPDYGTSGFAMRIALAQLHTQAERLKLLGAPVFIQMVFPDMDRDDFPQEIIQYGAETGFFTMSKQLEEYWGELKANRQVYPLPFINPTRKLS